jgi:hypothetical protein
VKHHFLKTTLAPYAYTKIDDIVGMQTKKQEFRSMHASLVCNTPNYIESLACPQTTYNFPPPQLQNNATKKQIAPLAQ